MAELFPHITGQCIDFYDYEPEFEAHDLIICCEVMEHLVNPEKAVERFYQMNAKHYLFGVPNEPWFRLTAFLRGKNVSRWGNPIDHVNHWNKRSFEKMLSKYFEIKQVRTPYPWLLVHAVLKD